MFSKELAAEFPESYDNGLPAEVVYCGNCSLTEPVQGTPVDAGRLVLSPTRTYAPVVKAILDSHRGDVHGMIHCSGGAQTKVMNFVGNVHVIKDNLFEVPPLFELIRRNSGAEPSEMYKVFNMGHRFEIYCDADTAPAMVDIARSFGVDARIVGRVEADSRKHLTLKTPYGTIEY